VRRHAPARGGARPRARRGRWRATASRPTASRRT
jgi:hypothetical protein